MVAPHIAAGTPPIPWSTLRLMFFLDCFRSREGNDDDDHDEDGDDHDDVDGEHGCNNDDSQMTDPNGFRQRPVVIKGSAEKIPRGSRFL